MDEALEREGLADPRPLYRKLLLRLKNSDPEAFQEATRRYEEQLVPALAEEGADPVAAWISYGRWVAERLEPGKVVAVDQEGRARPVETNPTPGPRDLLLYVPHEGRAPAIALAFPREPSEAQKATAELLVR
jgi:hypothetical protein